MAAEAGPEAPGSPGIEPRWTSSAKDGIGTAYSASSRLWFTLSHGIVNEIYFPHVDMPNTRDLQFLITDGETFCHEERRDLDHALAYPEPEALLYRLTNTDRQGRYRLIKEVIGEPHSSVLLMHTRLEILDPAFAGKLKLYALLSPHLQGTGNNNSAHWLDLGGRKLFHAHREDIHLAFGCSADFTKRSVGFVGKSDGWQDLAGSFAMDWEYREARDGNISVTGEIDLSRGPEFVLGVGFGHGRQSASTKLLQALATPFAELRARYVKQWGRIRPDVGRASSGSAATLADVSQAVLLAHEDKEFAGAFVASLSIPWGETKDDRDLGGYHLVWTRDMVQTATALLACGRKETPLRALVWLSCVQGEDGGLPQNCSISGEPYWKGIQLDEVAMPILLAWRVRREGALRDFDPWTLIARAARYLILRGPVTGQERWEENSGYSPSTLAAIIAGLVVASEFARDRGDTVTGMFLLDHADWLSSHLEEWTAANRGDLVPGIPRHYMRILPADPAHADGEADPDHAIIRIANGGGDHPARNVVGGDFLQLVRFGVRAADDPLIVASLQVIDRILKYDLPQGPGWRRYNHDGYGQKPDGGAYDGTGQGRCWPLLTGERGHYELEAGRDPLPYLEAMERFANAGNMLPEQVWDAEALPEAKFAPGLPTGSAMPLCWAHAEYLTLARSRKDGVVFDRIEPVYQRYARAKTQSRMDIWTRSHPIRRMSRGNALRILTERPARIRWSVDAGDGGKAGSGEAMTAPCSLGLFQFEWTAEQLRAANRLSFSLIEDGSEAKEGNRYAIGIVPGA